MTTTKRRHEGSRSACLGAILATYAANAGGETNPHRIGLAVEDMQRATRAAKNWEVRRCNVPMTEAQEERGRRRIERAQDAINATLATFGQHGADAGSVCKVDLGGDPRSACGRLHIPGQRGDGWGDGFAIY